MSTAAARSFVHLHCHTHYSLLDGANLIPELVAHVKAAGMSALAITDHGNLCGAIEFYKGCQAAGIKPIIGCEVYTSVGRRTERTSRPHKTIDPTSGKSETLRNRVYYHLTLLAKNRVGFQNLVKLSSLGYLDGFYYKPRIDDEALAAHHEGLICLSGCAASEFSQYILSDQLDQAARVGERLARLFGPDFYVEIMNNELPGPIQRLQAAGAIDLAKAKGWPLVATCDAHYLMPADVEIQQALMKIANKDECLGGDFSVAAPADVYRRFPDHADAVQRSQEIADGVDIALNFKARHFPVFTPPEQLSPEDYLRRLCATGLIERYGATPPVRAQERLDFELGVICKMGFASYFLIVSDFVRFAVAQHIPCSARGSAVGSLVSFVLKISHVDPFDYELLFERFLDPSRTDPPDIDIDFCQERRGEVIRYVQERYGAANVAQIATFGTLGAKQALKDAGKKLGADDKVIAALAALVPGRVGTTLESALEEVDVLRHTYEEQPLFKAVVELAKKLEGYNRSTGTHAAGIVITPGPLTDYVPLQRVKQDENTTAETMPTTQWSMGDIEAAGLLKMDFLGLRTLTLMDHCVHLIQDSQGEDVNVFDLPLDDSKTFQMLRQGKTDGVFQLECVAGDTLLNASSTMTIEKLLVTYASYPRAPLPCMLSVRELDQVLVLNQVEHIVASGKKQLYRIRTQKGLMLRATAEHRLLVYMTWVPVGHPELASSWVAVQDLLVGMAVLTVQQNTKNYFETTMDCILSVEKDTIEETFDLVMRAPFNSYVANGLVVHNSSGIRELLKRMLPDSVHDLIATNALYRPGPLKGGMVDAYVERKHGRQAVPSIHPILDKILAQTYGVLCYQEQAMQVLNQLGGLELSAAYAVVKAISKKKKDVIEKSRDAFLKGVVERGLPQQTAESVFGLIVNFGSYSFNRSHSSSYGLIGYQTAYLKAHYPAEFMAALLTSHINDGSKMEAIRPHIQACRLSGLELLPPHINDSGASFTVRDGKLRCGLALVKEVTPQVAGVLVRVRGQEPFRHLLDLVQRTDGQGVDRTALRNLLYVGALDCLGGNRAQLDELLTQALTLVRQTRKKDKEQTSLFDMDLLKEEMGTASQEALSLPNLPEWDEKHLAEKEREALGFNLTNDPLLIELPRYARYASMPIKELLQQPEGQSFNLVARIGPIREHTGKDLARMAFLTLEEADAKIDAAVWASRWSDLKPHLLPGIILVLRGSLSRKKPDSPLFIIEDLWLPKEGANHVSELWLQMPLTQYHPDHVNVLATMLQAAPGPLPVYLQVVDPQGRQMVMRVTIPAGVDPERYDHAGLQTLLGTQGVRLV